MEQWKVHWGLLLFVTALQLSSLAAKPPRPHVILIVADDLGWNDVSFHGSAIHTPNIDRLARQGVILNNYYVSPICTPTRSAIMTGLHPVHTGMQHEVIGGATPYGVPLDKKLMSQYLKDLGYTTRIVGKWHLGHFAKEYLPLQRGFDSHFGYYTGHSDYFDHSAEDSGFWGLDLHRDGAPVRSLNEQYSTEFYTQEAEEIIRSHNASQSLFLYLAEQAVHAGNFHGDPIQAPQSFVNRFPQITNAPRKIFAGVASALDDSVGRVVAALEETGLMKDAVLAFTTDNGGPLHGYDRNSACNWPLRGMKNTMWEGGVRGVGLVYSPLLPKSGYVSQNLFHVSDWLPTLYEAAGGGAVPGAALDGVSQWQSLVTRGRPARTELLHNIDPIEKFSAIRVGDYKLVQGEVPRGDWYPCGAESSLAAEEEPNWQALALELKKGSENTATMHMGSQATSIHVKCGRRPFNVSTNCLPADSPCLFHIPSDPCEFNNVAAQHPDIVQELQARIKDWASSMVPPGNKPVDPQGNPQLHGGVWGPWM